MFPLPITHHVTCLVSDSSPSGRARFWEQRFKLLSSFQTVVRRQVHQGYKPFGRKGIQALWQERDTSPLAGKGYKPFGYKPFGRKRIQALWQERDTSPLAGKGYKPFGYKPFGRKRTQALWLERDTSPLAGKGYKPFGYKPFGRKRTQALWLERDTSPLAGKGSGRKETEYFMLNPSWAKTAVVGGGGGGPREGRGGNEIRRVFQFSC